MVSVINICRSFSVIIHSWAVLPFRNTYYFQIFVSLPIFLPAVSQVFWLYFLVPLAPLSSLPGCLQACSIFISSSCIAQVPLSVQSVLHSLCHAQDCIWNRVQKQELTFGQLENGTAKKLWWHQFSGL